MHQKLRLRILKKLAQTTQTAAPSTTAPPVGAPPGLPAELTATLNVAYNPDTALEITKLLNILNDSLHHASNGKGSFQKIKNNAFDPNDSAEPGKSIGNVTKQVYSTFCNNGNAHTVQYDPKQIGNWCDTILGSSAYNDLATVKPGSPLSTKLQSITGGGTLKDAIRKELDLIKTKNPITT